MAMVTMTETARSALLVEDLPPLRRLLAHHLRRMGFRELHEAASGAAALLLLERHRPDLVCLDLVLPDVSGYDVCEFIRGSERLAGVPVLMLSGHCQPQDRACAEEAGAAAFLAKPFTQEQFERHVHYVLARAPA